MAVGPRSLLSVAKHALDALLTVPLVVVLSGPWCRP